MRLQEGAPLMHALFQSNCADLRLLVHPKMHAGSGSSARFHYAPQPNWSFNADANTGHAFGILMACVGALRTSCSGAG